MQKIGRVIKHGIVGGIRQKLTGGSFKAGFLAAAITQGFSRVLDKMNAFAGDVTKFAVRAKNAALAGGLAYGIGHGGVGGTSLFKSPVGTAVAHGVSQGAVGALRGGSFKSGFLGGLVDSLIGGVKSIGKYALNKLERGVMSIVAGGAAAAAAGGKFANGAMSAAFVYLFNHGMLLAKPPPVILRPGMSRAEIQKALGRPPPETWSASRGEVWKPAIKAPEPPWWARIIRHLGGDDVDGILPATRVPNKYKSCELCA